MEKFKTVKELNIVAAVMKIDRNLTGLIELAEKYGLEKEDAEDYMDSDDPEDCLCNATMAAIAKLKLEEQDLHLESQLKDWKDFIVQMLTDYPVGHDGEDRDTLANAVFNPEKKLLDVLAAGLKPQQMNLGIGFYGRVPKRAVEPGIDWSKSDAQNNPVTQPYFGPQELSLFKSLGYDLTKDTYVKYNDIVRKLLNDPQKRFTEHWDEQAKVPWLSVKSADGKALFAISYENPRSVAIKADYIKEKGLAGAMFWEYGADDENQLAKQLAESLGIPHQ